MAEISGTDNAETLLGNDDQNDLIRGLGGDDQLFGLGNADTLVGGNRNDTLDGGEGLDVADYSQDGGVAGITVNLGTGPLGTFYGMTLEGGRSRDTWGFIDVLTSIESIVGTSEVDTFRGSAGADEFIGGGGNDRFLGGAGADTLRGGTGLGDIVRYDAEFGDHATTARGIVANLAAETFAIAGRTLAASTVIDTYGDQDMIVEIEEIVATAASDLVAGGSADEVLRGLGGADTLYGGAGRDRLYGGDDHDLLIGGDGEDILEGGAGIDTADYAAETRLVTATRGIDANLQTGNVRDAFGTMDSLSDIEHLIGTSLADTMVGSVGDEIFEGGAGDDLLDGGIGSDSLMGGAGNDTYVADAADILIEEAGGGTDTVRSVASHTLGEHFEVLLGDGSSASTLVGNHLANTIRGNGAENLLQGLAGNDTLDGGAGHDSLDGGTGADEFIGGTENDTYYVDGLDRIVERADEGLDTLISSGSFALSGDAYVEILRFADARGRTSFNLTGSSGDNEITGNAGANILKGQGGSDRLFGGAGKDRLLGGDASDRLSGGTGRDILDGGKGRDFFLFDTKASASNVDDVRNYSVREDSILLENKVFKVGKASASPTKLLGLKPDLFAVGPTAQDATDRIIYDKATGALYYDRDGTGAAAQVQIAKLKAGLAMSHKEFFVV
ncbi:MAG TPA: calcium-binding protein [Microvirga sp.]|jgi:Ca2+-binding RTX toxin-like protein